MSATAKPQLICLGNPLLDYQATVQPEYLEKYGLKPDDAILVDAASNEPRMAIFEEMLTMSSLSLVVQLKTLLEVQLMF